MSFSDCIPDKLQEYSDVSAFMSVLDSLQNFKTELIAEYLRSHNFAILTDMKWLLRNLEDFGVRGLPLNYPMQIVQQYLLNVDTLCRTRGSKIGIELYCSLLSFGEVIVEDEDFYGESTVIMLDSPIQGYLTSDNEGQQYHIADNNVIEPLVKLNITIKSKYFNGDYPNESSVIKKFIEESIEEQLGFSTNKEITFKYRSRDDFYYHKLLNTYFI